MLYRTGAGRAWGKTQFILKGSHTEGKIIVDNLQKGEYTLGVLNSKYEEKTKK
jgi:hypothetical protein